MRIIWGLWAASLLSLCSCTGNIENDIEDKELIKHGRSGEQLRGYVSGDYLPPGAPERQPVSVSYNTEWDDTVLTLWQPGFQSAGPTSCMTPDRSNMAGTTQVDVCPGHYPNMAAFDGAGDWGPLFFGQSFQRRVALALRWGLEERHDTIDLMAGWTCAGASMGSGRCLALAGTMREVDPLWAQTLTVIKLYIPPTRHWETNDLKAEAAKGWPNDNQGYDLHVNPVWMGAMGSYDDYYFSIVMGSNDRVGGQPVDGTLIKALQDNQVCHRAVYHANGHSASEPGVRLGWNATYEDTKVQQARLDIPVIAFTQSTADRCLDENGNLYERGHCNLGLSWDAGKVVDTETVLSVPIRYRAHKDIGGGIPDQQDHTTVSVTFRTRINYGFAENGDLVGHATNFLFRDGMRYEWRYKDQSGVVTATGREVTIEGVKLESGDDYEPITVKPYQGFTLTPLYYLRQPRVSGTVDFDDSNMSPTIDTGNIWATTEADLVLDDRQGNVTVIEDCTGQGRICAALAAKASPDKQYIAYEVSEGESLKYIPTSGGRLTGKAAFHTTRATLWLYEVATGKKIPLTNGHRDRQPDWCGNRCLVFTSDRSGLFPLMGRGPSNWFNSAYSRKEDTNATQLYRMRLTDDLKAEGMELLWPAEHFVMSPKVFPNGDICASTWQGYLPREPGTPENSWPISCSDANGANLKAEFAWHGTTTLDVYSLIADIVDPRRSGEKSTQARSTRPIEPLSLTEAVVTNYYRANWNGAFGQCIAYERSFSTVEGATQSINIDASSVKRAQNGTGLFTPSTTRLITPFGTDQDLPVRFDKQGRALGNAGYCTAWPGDEYYFIASWQRGYAYRVAPDEDVTREALGGEPPAHKLVFGAKVPVVTNPFDPEQIDILACGDEKYHCWDARPLASHQELFGTPEPATLPPLGDEPPQIQVVNMKMSELDPIPWDNNYKSRVTKQGNAHKDYPAAQDMMLCIDKVIFPKYLPKVPGPERRELIACAFAEDDGSIYLEAPKDTPFLMYAMGILDTIDPGFKPVIDGAIAEDNAFHSLKAGETMRCFGCHDGHSEERAKVLGDLDEAWAKTLSARKAKTSR